MSEIDEPRPENRVFDYVRQCPIFERLDPEVVRLISTGMELGEAPELGFERILLAEQEHEGFDLLVAGKGGTVRLDATEEAGGWFISVSDNGQGISEKDMKQLFTPFFTTKEVGKGSGLGLPSVYGFAKQSGGHLTIESTLGEGTAARFYLPRAALQPEERSREPRAEMPKGKGETILLVEDSSDMRQGLNRIMRFCRPVLGSGLLMCQPQSAT